LSVIRKNGTLARSSHPIATASSICAPYSI
jgi:hypothetical protein